MDERWSQFSQRAEMMDATRALRFSPQVLRKLSDFAGDFAGSHYLEIGCGPGALLRALAKRYPDKVFTGLDLDEGFIAYAKEHGGELPNASFLVGNAYALPFTASSLDGTLSHTVLEHVEHGRFYAEQLRVLKPGGQCLVMSIFPSASLYSEEPIEISGEEQDLQALKAEVYEVCKCLEAHTWGIHSQSPHDMPRHMEEAGFAQVRKDFQAVSVSRQPGDPRSILALEAEEITERSYIATTDAMEAEWAKTHPGYVRKWTREPQERLSACIAARYKKAREEVHDTWAVNVRMMMMMGGVKPDTRGV